MRKIPKNSANLKLPQVSIFTTPDASAPQGTTVSDPFAKNMKMNKWEGNCVSTTTSKQKKYLNMGLDDGPNLAGPSLNESGHHKLRLMKLKNWVKMGSSLT